MSASEGPVNRSAFSNRSFLVYLIGSTISLHGLWIYRVALGWYTWQLTESELWVGIIAFSQFAPAVVVGPLIGVMVDRWERRKASILSNTFSGINALVLGTLAWFGLVDILVLATLSLVQGALDGAHTPIRMTIIPSIVDKAQLQSAIASSSITFNVSRFVGPALAGIIIAKYGVSVAFMVNGLSYAAIVAAVSFVKLRARPARARPPAKLWTELLDGIHYVASHRVIRSLLISIAVASVFGRGALEMMPAFADAVFARGAPGLATFTAAIGFGSILSGVVLANNTAWLSIKVVSVTVALAGALISVLGITNDFRTAVALLFGIGILLSICGVGSQILIQTMVDEDVRGRVSSLWGMIAFGGTALGSVIVGTSAAVFGLQLITVITGILCTTVVLLAFALTSDNKQPV